MNPAAKELLLAFGVMSAFALVVLVISFALPDHEGTPAADPLQLLLLLCSALVSASRTRRSPSLTATASGAALAVVALNAALSAQLFGLVPEYWSVTRYLIGLLYDFLATIGAAYLAGTAARYFQAMKPVA